MSFGEVNKKGNRNTTAYVIRGARQTRVEWVTVYKTEYIFEAFGKDDSNGDESNVRQSIGFLKNMDGERPTRGNLRM